MTLRAWLPAFGLAFLALPVASVAQKHGSVWRVGFLASRHRPASLESDFYGEVPRGLLELGYVEGKNLVIEWRFADGRYERLAELATELVRLDVDIIMADGANAALAAQKATKTIPIVFGGVNDPVNTGLVESLAHPGGNATGLALIASATNAKQMEMLRTLVPGLARVGVLWNPANPSSHPSFESVQAAALSIRLKVLSLEARTPAEIEGAFTRAGDEGIGAMVVSPDLFLTQQLPEIAMLAAKYRLPCVGGLREFAEAGGLMSYGASRGHNYRRAATYIDKILRGASPGDLPVEQPTKFELVINRRTARALGLAVPPELLVQADKVIE